MTDKGCPTKKKDGNNYRYRRQAGEKVLAQGRHRSQKSRHILAWNAWEIPPACTCYLKVISITGLGLQELNHRASRNILSQYMSGFKNRAHLSTTTLTVFQEITGDFSIDQPQAV